MGTGSDLHSKFDDIDMGVCKMEDLNEFAREVHENAVAHGWWEEDRSFGEIIALCHSEDGARLCHA